MTPVLTSIAIAVNQRQLVLSDHEVLYVLQRMENYKIYWNLRQQLQSSLLSPSAFATIKSATCEQTAHFRSWKASERAT